MRMAGGATGSTARAGGGTITWAIAAAGIAGAGGSGASATRGAGASVHGSGSGTKGGVTSYSRNLPPKSYAATPPVARTWMIIKFLDVVIFNILHCK